MYYTLAYYTSQSIWYVMGGCVVLIALFMNLRRMTPRLEEPIQYKVYGWISALSLVVLLGFSFLTWYADSRTVALRAEFNDSDRELLARSQDTMSAGERSQLFDILNFKPVSPEALGAEDEARFRRQNREYYRGQGLSDAQADTLADLRLNGNP